MSDRTVRGERDLKIERCTKAESAQFNVVTKTRLAVIACMVISGFVFLIAKIQAKVSHAKSFEIREVGSSCSRGVDSRGTSDSAGQNKPKCG